MRPAEQTLVCARHLLYYLLYITYITILSIHLNRRHSPIVCTINYPTITLPNICLPSLPLAILSLQYYSGLYPGLLFLFPQIQSRKHSNDRPKIISTISGLPVYNTQAFSVGLEKAFAKICHMHFNFFPPRLILPESFLPQNFPS